MLSRAKDTAKRRGLECTITAEDIVIPTHCPIFGTPLLATPGKVSPNSPSIDRIDNSRGYVPGNIIVISFRANRIKSDASLSELQALVAFLDTLQHIKTPP